MSDPTMMGGLEPVAAVDPVPDGLDGVSRNTWLALRGIVSERQRQIAVEGYDDAHDDDHLDGELARAAACYAISAAMACYPADAGAVAWMKAVRKELWPWDEEYLKPKDPIRDLERAGALILAELERRARAATARGG